MVGLTLAAPALAVKPGAVANPLCPLLGQTGTCTQLAPVAPLLPAAQPKFVNELPQPVFYNPDQSNSQFDYYEIFSGPAGVGLAAPKFPFDLASTSAAVVQPDVFSPAISVNKVWLGLCNITPLPGTTCPVANRLYTEVWGYGQKATIGATPVLGGPIATYPAMSFRATRGKPVKVKWINQLPNTHMFCKEPLNSDVPCAIDRSLMGTLVGPGQSVGPYGGPQQADNAMVVHLHGGEIPPDSDGFAELWFGNGVTAAAYTSPNIDPPFVAPPGNAIVNPQPAPAACDLLAVPAIPCTNFGDQCIGNTAAGTPGVCWNGQYQGNGTTAGDPLKSATPWLLGSLVRPTGDSMIYNYPMVQDSATIWYHDHALGKTRVNVAAGPAGYFYVQDPAVETALWGATSDAAAGYFFGNCTNAGILAGQCRDVPIVLQDRAFNADGSINFPNLLGQITKNKFNPLTPGPNPTIHPQWVPEYFGDHAVVNGITWPKLTVAPGTAYRFRFLDGSNARCYTLSLADAVTGLPGPAFNVIASDQGYLPAPVATPTFTMCPGERYEVIVNFPAAGTFNLVNTAGAPFPAGITPQAPNSPDAFLANMMQFTVGAAPAATAWTYNPATWTAAVAATKTRIDALTAAGQPGLLPTQPLANAAGIRKYFVLNEVLDPLTKAPLRVQIDAKPFEAPITETPKRGTTEVWDIVNTTVDAHPMHLHLVQFKVIGRWAMDMNKYTKAAVAGFPPVVNKAIDPWAYVIGAALPLEPGEQGLKDTAKSYPGQLLRVVATWDGGWADKDPVNFGNTPFGKILPACEAPLATDLIFVPATPTSPACRCVQTTTTVVDPVTGAVTTVPACGATIYKPYFQNVSSGPYVWHCHIVDHEDNEMMRPTLVLP